MSIALQMKMKELEERVENLVQTLNASDEKQEQLEKRLSDMENKYHMLNARIARGKT